MPIQLSEKDFTDLKFENFIDTQEGEDILEKTIRLDKILSSGVKTGSEALGMVTMNKVQPDSSIREKDGSVHPVIMLGSNSYLNLSTHKRQEKLLKDSVMEWVLFLIMRV